MWTGRGGSALPALGDEDDAPNGLLLFAKPLAGDVVARAFAPDWVRALADRSPLGDPVVAGLLLRLADPAAGRARLPRGRAAAPGDRPRDPARPPPRRCRRTARPTRRCASAATRPARRRRSRRPAGADAPGAVRYGARRGRRTTPTTASAARPCRGTGPASSPPRAATPRPVTCPWCEGTGRVIPGHDAQQQRRRYGRDHEPADAPVRLDQADGVDPRPLAQHLEARRRQRLDAVDAVEALRAGRCRACRRPPRAAGSRPCARVTAVARARLGRDRALDRARRRRRAAGRAEGGASGSGGRGASAAASVASSSSTAAKSSRRRASTHVRA